MMNARSIRLLVAPLLMLICGLSEAGVSEGVAAYNAGDYETALNEFEAAAKDNDPVAQGNLGWMYEHGEGVDADPEQALIWYNLAAENGGDPNLEKRQQLTMIVLHKKMTGHKEDPNSLASIDRSKKQALKAALASSSSGSNSDSSYGAKVRACIRAGVDYSVPPRTGYTTPTVTYRATIDDSGRVASLHMEKSSGFKDFDAAVEKGIRNCEPFPKPSSGGYPSYLILNYKMYG